MKFKKILLLTFCIFIVTKSSFSQNLLKADWKFSTGDNLEWKSNQFDDSHWKAIDASKLWEGQGYGNYDGYGWYRQTIIIPKKLKKTAKKEDGLILYLGAIDDADETFWNGKKIGSTGTLPPNYAGEYATPRKYKIPLDVIDFGKPNLIAVRVYDHGGGGGIYGDDIFLGLPGMKDLLTMELAGLPADQVFLQKENHNCNIVITNKSKDNYNGNLKIEIESDFGKSINTIEKNIAIKSQSVQKENINLGTLDAGFYTATVIFASENGNKKISFGLGVRPTEISSPTDRPDDFEDYWKRAKKELAAVAPQFKMIRQDELCTPDREVFLVEMRSLGNALVRGWYSRPTAEGQYPAVLKVQGYSTNLTPNRLYSENDMITFALNIRGHGNSQSTVQPGFPGYLQHFVEDKEMYIYRGAYMDCVRAVDFLFAQAEVDQTRVAVEGGSQGGALSFATAALDNERIAICLPDVPFLSDWPDYFQVAAWPTGEFMKYLEDNPHFSKDEMLHNLSYIDIKNLAPWIKAPLFMGIGLVDKVCPPHINFAAYNQVTSPKKYTVFPTAGHGLPGSHYGNKLKIIRDFFGME